MKVAFFSHAGGFQCYNKVVKVAVMADIHSNLEALEAVLEEVKGVDQIWCLGDVVGYGPNPNECCQIVEKKAQYCLAGNHDKGVLGKVDLSWFNEWAIEAIKITRKILTEKNQEFLASLPEIIKLDEAILAHGSPRNSLFEYIFDTMEAEKTLAKMTRRFCFVGHTHRPAVFKKDQRRLINPGAVGQPRDGDWRASFGLFNDQDFTFKFKRVEYPLEKTQKKMQALGLPPFLIKRLALGR